MLARQDVSAKFYLQRAGAEFQVCRAGIRLMLASQHNAWVHAGATIVVCAAGLAFHLAAGEWCWIVAAIMAVWTAEALNTSLEFLCDVASADFHPLVEKSKDIAAGAVLISAVGATIIGLLIFVPHIAVVLRGLKH